MKNDKILNHLNKAIEKQVPDVWDGIESHINKLHKNEVNVVKIMPNTTNVVNKKRNIYKSLTLIASICLIVSTLTFKPVLAAIQSVIDKIFSSQNIDDSGVRQTVSKGMGQILDKTFYDKENDITVHFESVVMDDKETKLLLTYTSNKTNLSKYYFDIFEGKSSVNIIVNGKKKRLRCVGWGSRYYDSKENKVAEALSFQSIKDYEGKDVQLELKNLTIYDEGKSDAVLTKWPLTFKLDQSAISVRETIQVNKDFKFKNQTYKIKKVEYSELETRVVITGTDTKLITEDGLTYRVMSKLEEQFLNAREFDKKLGYIVNPNKSGVFLKSAGEKVEPIFSKGEVEGEKDEYIMFFAPVKNRKDCTLEVGDTIKVSLTK